MGTVYSYLNSNPGVVTLLVGLVGALVARIWHTQNETRRDTITRWVQVAVHYAADVGITWDSALTFVAPWLHLSPDEIKFADLVAHEFAREELKTTLAKLGKESKALTDDVPKWREQLDIKPIGVPPSSPPAP